MSITFRRSQRSNMAQTTPLISRESLPEAIREHIKQSEFILKHPPKEFKFSADPSTINAFDIDLTRLTALFVARNGRKFLTDLMTKEAENLQFDFLKPQHSNFKYFTELVEQYTSVIILSHGLLAEIREGNTRQAILENVRYRVGWEKYQKALIDRECAEEEEERLAYSQIDWHDFVVLNTIDFQPSETIGLPALCSPKDVGTRIVLQQRTEELKNKDVAMEIESGSEGEVEDKQMIDTLEVSQHDSALDSDVPIDKQHSVHRVTQPAPAPPIEGNVTIRDYDPKRPRLWSKPLDENFIISPLTNERVLASKLQEHVQYNTVDPLYREQREREQFEREDQVQANASGTEISKNIAKLAERRTDIFGVGPQGAVQTIIGKKLGEEEEECKSKKS